MTLTIILAQTGSCILCVSGHPEFVLKAISNFGTLHYPMYSWRVNPSFLEPR